jgi:hypothetical protein
MAMTELSLYMREEGFRKKEIGNVVMRKEKN